MRAMANGSSHSRNKRSSRRNELHPHHIQKKILSHSDVRWAERQESKVRTKRDSFSNQNYSPFQHRSEAGASSGNVPYIQKLEPRDKFRSSQKGTHYLSKVAGLVCELCKGPSNLLYQFFRRAESL